MDTEKFALGLITLVIVICFTGLSILGYYTNLSNRLDSKNHAACETHCSESHYIGEYEYGDHICKCIQIIEITNMNEEK